MKQQIDMHVLDREASMITTATASAATTTTTYTVTPAKAHDWATCGGFYAARHRPGSRFAQNYACLLGTATHELVVAYDRVARPQEYDLDALIARHWRPGRFGVEEDDQARADARALLEVYGTAVAGETVQILDHECFMQTERRSLGDGRYIVLSGRMDRVARRQDGTIEVLDVKTGNSLPTPDELRHDPGTAIYHLLAADRYGASAICIAQLSLRTGAGVEVCLSPDDIVVGKSKLRDMVGQLAADEFTLSPNGACAYCLARQECPALHREGNVEIAEF